jgi:sugar/nucleoside kinase (ribokinase family)
LYVSGYALMNTGSRPFARAALDVARERGWSIAVDAASSAPLAAVGGSTFLDWLGHGVVLFANTDEAHVLTGIEEPAAAAQALAQRCGQAIVKRGVAGAVWSDGSGVRSVPAEPTTVLDSTGAGDAFAAGYLAADGDVPQALERAARLAALAVSRIGARPELD